MRTFVVLILAQFVACSPRWSIVSDQGPEPRYINQLVNTETELFLFGGKNNTNNGFDDLWVWKDGIFGDTWKLKL